MLAERVGLPLLAYLLALFRVLHVIHNLLLHIPQVFIHHIMAVSPVSGGSLEAVNALLEHDPDLRIAIEPKPNEPMDLAYIPTIGHALALGFQANDPARVGALVESAHAVLAGLDPSDEMGFALACGKLWGVHLNDQNGELIFS